MMSTPLTATIRSQAHHNWEPFSATIIDIKIKIKNGEVDCYYFYIDERGTARCENLLSTEIDFDPIIKERDPEPNSLESISRELLYLVYKTKPTPENEEAISAMAWLAENINSTATVTRPKTANDCLAIQIKTLKGVIRHATALANNNTDLAKDTEESFLKLRSILDNLK